MVTLHALIDETVAPEPAIRRIKARIRERFGIEHTTVEVEHERCADTREAQATPA